MAKVTVTTTDPIHYKIYNAEESADLFGSDYVEEFGIELPNDLLEEYTKAYHQFWAIQDKITKFMKGK